MAKPAVQQDFWIDNIPYYEKWQLGEGIPILKTFFVQDLRKVELKSWGPNGWQRRLHQHGRRGRNHRRLCFGNSRGKKPQPAEASL